MEKDKTQAVASQGIDEGQSQGPAEGQVSSVDRRSRGLSQRIEALFTAPPGHGSEERLARMKEVDTVSRMRRLSLRSSDSWDGLHGVGRWGEYDGRKNAPFLAHRILQTSQSLRIKRAVPTLQSPVNLKKQKTTRQP